jgi:DNA-binding beta-propeller fold protein YncE
MRCSIRTVACVALTVSAALAPAAARAAAPSAPGHWSSGHAVFVQTNDPAGNSVVVYDRADDGALLPAGVYPTDGLGGALDGAVVDHLASQGSLVLDRADRLLYAVNAGSNTISVFGVNGDRLALRQVVSSGGTFPVSLTVRGDLIYVLNARDGASVQGYIRVGDHLVAVPQWRRNLGLDQSFENTPTEFLHSPGQVAFTPDGSHLLVTTKANGNDVYVFGVDRWGALSTSPVVNSAGAVPFAMAFDRSGHLVLTETGTDTIVSFDVRTDGGLRLVSAVPTEQAASCWIALAGPGLLYVSNAGSATESEIADEAGNLTDVGNAPADPGTIDAAGSSNGRFLYVETGAHNIVDEFAIGHGGTLTSIGSVAVPAPVGSEGIAAS